ncbi:MAG TPA: 50S ribosomal protein L4 [Candidatus Nanoarchaeia archaeon]|nr:50S ribosomal protein L4 [Candidatus Nanoarchaeia archaeon]
MKISLVDKTNKRTGDVELASQFSEGYRPDLIKRAVHALQSSARQKYGADPLAGKRSSSKTSKRRRKYRGTYGFGISRVNRKILSRRGMRMFWVGAFTPQTVGGRRSHPPKSDKNWEKKINKKENRKAVRSAMGATLNKTIVAARGHKIPEGYPCVIDGFEDLKKTADVEKVLHLLGFGDELSRSMIKKIRAGLGKTRGRKYQRKKGILIVVGKDCPLIKSASNIAGVDIVEARNLNAELLAPGAMPGRVTLWTKNAVDEIKEKKLFA